MEFKTLALVATVLLAASQLESTKTNSFVDYQATFGKSYSDVESAFRQAVYNSNVDIMNKHNADSTQTYKMGINRFTDMTQEEFESVMLTRKSTTPAMETFHDFAAPVGDVNWVSQGAVSGVKDQGACGSCWAFGASQAVESEKWIQTGTLGNASEQQLCDCDTVRNNGCFGGWEYLGMQYYAQNGICTGQSYPYQSGNGQAYSCRQSSCTTDSFRVTGYRIVAGVSQLQSANNQRPMAVACDASNWSSYSSGIFSNCGRSLNHAIQLGGYTSQYWLVRNSWGAGWGESGYIRLLGNASTCGIADDASYPTV